MCIASSAVVIRSIKTASFAAGRYVGLSRFIGQTTWRRRRLLILCYHGVSLRDEHEWNPGLYVSPSTLLHRMQQLERGQCTVLPLGEAVERLYREDLPDRAVALTFDDGYYDFAAKAWPILAQFGYPATVYFPTLRSEHNFPVVNLVLSYVLWKGRRSVLPGAGLEGFDSVDYPLATPAQRQQVLARFDAHIRASRPSLAQKDDRVRQLARRLGVDYDELCEARLFTVMRANEVADFSSRGVDFELHTHRHRTPEDPALFADEIRENRLRLEPMIGRPAVHFCYPSGVTHPGYLEVLEAAGIQTATTTRPGIADATSHRLLLPRFVDTNLTTDAEFDAWLQGLAPWIRQVA